MLLLLPCPAAAARPNVVGSSRGFAAVAVAALAAAAVGWRLLTKVVIYNFAPRFCAAAAVAAVPFAVAAFPAAVSAASVVRVAVGAQAAMSRFYYPVQDLVAW